MRIISSDILIADVIAPVQGNAPLAALAEKYKLRKGGKVAIGREQFSEFSKALEGHKTTIAPGGSSANVLTTVSKLLGNRVDIHFIGAVGEGPQGDMIRRSLEEAHITLLPDRYAGTLTPESAVSFVLVYPDGARTIATYPGNARELLAPEMITDALVQTADAALIQGSLWTKMGSGYAGRLLALCKQYEKQVWLALPTYSMPGGQHVETFRDVIADAQVVLGNDEELARIYNTDAQSALLQLQRSFTHQIGFITHGAQGAALVTANKIQNIKPIPMDSETIINTLGAGDTAFAGFMAGIISGMTPHQSAEMAMVLASEKLKVNGPRLADPATVLQKFRVKSLFITG